MSKTTNINHGGVCSFNITVGGTAIPNEMLVVSIAVEKTVNRISSAQVTLLDGEASTGDFTSSSSSTFVPGAEISIEAGYDNTNEVIFKGIITGQTIQIDQNIGSALIVECRDEAVKMIVGRKSLTYTSQTDSAIISSIIGNYSGLTASVGSTDKEWLEQVQYYATDWDFILARAEANGMIVTTLNNEVSVQTPNNDTTSVLDITFGHNLLEFNADLNAITQLGSAQANTWDYTSQEVINGEASSDVSGPGNLSTQTLSEVVGLSSFNLQTVGPLEESDLTNWSKAALVKSEYSKIQGTAKFQGTSLVDPGKYITMGGVGDRFNGDHFISGVIHTITEGNWTTEAQLGMSPVWFTEEPDVIAPLASGLLPGIRGLMLGTVKQMYEDPDNQYRILVNLPLFDPNGEGIWARLANFYSTSGAGAFFLPEVGDEVVLGFLNEDPRYPIILGSLYSSESNQPFEGLDPNQNNSPKAIVSKSGIYIQFDDENKVLTLTTPANNKIVFSDQDKQIAITDENNNSITMAEGGITVQSESNITVKASESLTLQGDSGVTIESSTGAVSISGMTISVNADTEYSLNGGATASISSEAELSISSGMVMIN